MGHLTGEQIAQRVADLNLLDHRQLQEVWSDFGRQDVSSDDFLQQLVRRELLTNYQVERLLNGDRSGFFYGDYKVLYRVATGSFARVYRAVHKDTGQIVALKVLRKRFCDDPQQTEQFHREGEMGRTLRHPNIVPIYEVASRGRDHFLVMEFVEGGNLRDFIKIRKKVDPAEATRLLIDLTSGLHYAAQRGISHRDLKLTNALVSSRGQAKLVDFGLAGADDRVTDDLAGVTNPRTIDYAGLERATGVRKDDARSDIYFMGCIFYHLLTGRPALQETKDRVQRLSKSRFLEVEPVQKLEPSLPRVVAMVCNKALEFDPSRRYQNPGEMLVDLKVAAERLAEGTDTDSAEVDKGGAEVKDSERQRWAAMLIPQSERRVLMFVESNMKMQDIFRDGLKRCGYRVLLTSDPQRALSRFDDDAKAADCVIFSTGNLGERALEAFNRFGEADATKDIPAVLLLGERQKAWKSKAKLGDGRIAVAMPIKLRQFRTLLAQLVPPTESAALPDGDG